MAPMAPKVPMAPMASKVPVYKVLVIYNKVSSKQLNLTSNQFQQFSKNIDDNNEYITYYEIYEGGDIINMYILKRDVYFGNYDDNDFNESLILMQTNLYNLLNKNSIIDGTVIFSFITNIRILMSIGGNTNINTFYEKIMDIIINNKILVTTTPSLKTITYNYNLYKNTNTFLNKKSSYSSSQIILILKNIYTSFSPS